MPAIAKRPRQPPHRLRPILKSASAIRCESRTLCINRSFTSPEGYTAPNDTPHLLGYATRVHRMPCNNPVLSSVFRPPQNRPAPPLHANPNRIHLHGEHTRAWGAQFKAYRTSYMYLNLNCAIFSSFTADKTHSISIWTEHRHMVHTCRCPHLLCSDSADGNKSIVLTTIQK